jgi:YycE-like C-terminal domain/YycE-like N-terminal domain
MYCRGLGVRVLASFQDHEGFDGAMVGHPGGGYHFEFTHCRAHPVRPTPTAEDLAVFFVPGAAEWEGACARMNAAGFVAVASFNPYWDAQGRTFEDPDGYRVVLQRADWSTDA